MLELSKGWDNRSLQYSKSVLYLRGPVFGDCALQQRETQKTSASATYMAVELLGHSWCHQSHFHPCPHTSNIQCWNGTEWAGNCHARHTEEQTEPLSSLFGSRRLRLQELLLAHADIWSFLLLWRENRLVNISVLTNNSAPLTVTMH